MNKKQMVIVGGTAAGLMGLTYKLWGKKDHVKSRFSAWKKERIRDAFFNTVTEEDVAWG